MRKKIGIIGHFGADKNFLDGQTVKTKILYDALRKKNMFDIVCVDTYYNKVDKIKLLKDTLLCILKCREIIILLSSNGIKFYFPLMYWCSKILRKNVYHDVIGGSLAEYVRRNPKWKKHINEFRVNWVESDNMKKDLMDLGVTNAEVLPNFKELTVNRDYSQSEQLNKDGCYFCTFSRVMKEKGITDAIEAIVTYNKENEKKAYLDVWGPVSEEYKEEFEKLTKENSEFIKYCGCADFSKSVETLKKYYALLFPTYWKSEGFPGTIIDAFAAGIPIIATDWNANSEIIDHMKTGIIYPCDEFKDLFDAISYAIKNEEKFTEMKYNCSEEAIKYLVETNITKIIDRLEKR